MTNPLRELYRSGQPNKEVASRKERFAALNELVTKRHGWLTSVPGGARGDDAMSPGLIAPDRIGKARLSSGAGRRGRAHFAHGDY
jgi:hypothetical protein